MTRTPNWGEFTARARPQPVKTEDDISEVFARHFNTPDGREVLGWLRAQTKERVLPGSVSDNVLRQHEGQRELCDKIERLIDQGIERITAQKMTG